MSIDKSRPRHRGMALMAAATGAFLLAACGGEETDVAPPPPEVRVLTVSTGTLANSIELPARLQAVRTAQVRARVDGIVDRRTYTEGTDVRAGQSLFAIDPRPLRAQLNSAEASLARAEATAANADQDVRRYEGLVARQALSQQEYDAAVARQRTAQADVAQARAQVESARLNLSYATVTAPISGRAGRALVTEGALVSAGSGTMLTTIEQIDTLFVNFSESNAQLASMRQSLASASRNDPLVVRVMLEDGTLYEEAGRLDFLDLSVDPATGTMALRARVPNAGRTLLPGQFVRVRVELNDSRDGMIVPQRAVTLVPDGASVMVLAAGDIAEPRAITLGQLRGDGWVVLSGLTAGERIIVDGLQRVRPGAPVRVANEAPPPAAADSSLSAIEDERGEAGATEEARPL